LFVADVNKVQANCCSSFIYCLNYNSSLPVYRFYYFTYIGV